MEFWLGLFGVLALIDISLELARIRKLMQRRLEERLAGSED